jgi:uncharacterized protein YcbX
MNQDATNIRIAGLFVHPVKSCARIALPAARLIDTGLEWDREWMIVDPDGDFVSQREQPRLALVRPQLRASDLVLRAPGMLALHLSLDAVESPRRVRVWDDSLPAYDMGDLAAQWFSDFLGSRVRLARYDPEARRVVDPASTGSTPAHTAFADGFPLLVLSSESIAELNRRRAAAGDAQPVTSERFRPNLVIDGVDAHGEDLLDRLEFQTADGPVMLRLVKPCVRCSIPDVDPARGEADHAVGPAIAAYRADARMGGRITFGVNAIVEQGEGALLSEGLEGMAHVRFE